LPNGALLPNSAHRSVSPLYQFLVLTHSILPILTCWWLSLLLSVKFGYDTWRPHGC
jgi:hypothetical protein